MRSAPELVNAVKRFQEMAGIPVNGDIHDPEVIQMMRKPRCGVADYDVNAPEQIVIGASRWDMNDLTYKSVYFILDHLQLENIPNAHDDEDSQND